MARIGSVCTEAHDDERSTAEELDNAPVLRSVDDLLIDGLTDAETDAFFASLDE